MHHEIDELVRRLEQEETAVELYRSAAEKYRVDGDPLEDIGVLVDPDRIHLVFRSGMAVSGTAQAPAL